MAVNVKDIDFDLEIELLEANNKLPDNMFIDETQVSLMIDGLTEQSYSFALEVLDISQTKVPVDKGFLKSRGRVEKTDTGYIVIYDTDYAVYVHENTGVRHKIGTSKFLSEAYEEALAKYSNIESGGGIGD